MKVQEVIEAMRDYAFKLDKLGYNARDNSIDYKARELFNAANKLREAANALEYVMQ